MQTVMLSFTDLRLHPLCYVTVYIWCMLLLLLLLRT